MSEPLHFKRKTYIIPEQMVADVEKWLKWMEKHALKDEEVEQLFIDFGMRVKRREGGSLEVIHPLLENE